MAKPIVIAVAAAVLAAQGPSAEARKLNRPTLSLKRPDTLFDVVGRSNKFVPPKSFAFQAGPLPTNAWWENFASAADPESSEGNIFQMPYVVMSCARAVHVIQPAMSENNGESYQKSAGLSIGITDETAAEGPYAADWDELSFTMGWRSGSKGWIMQVPLVRGSPYVTAEYNGAIPHIYSLQKLRMHNGQRWISVDGIQHPCDGWTKLKGRVFGLDVEEHDKTWLILASMHTGEGVQQEWTCQAEPFSLVASHAHTGGVRVALANDCTTGAHPVHCAGAPHGKDASEYAELLVQYGGTYPTGGKIDFFVDGDLGTMQWTWETNTMTGFEETEVVQLAWPVHKPLLASETRMEEINDVHAATPFKDVRGPTVAVVGNQWKLHYELMPDTGLAAFHPVDPAIKQQIIDTLAGPKPGMWEGELPDKDFELPEEFTKGMGDTYFSGKQFGRLAQLIAIANEVGQSHQPWFGEMVDRLQSAMESWLHKSSTTPFVYDLSWGGLISCGCEIDNCNGYCPPKCKVQRDPLNPQSCPALENSQANFGNSVYNDHHFHYGYWIYAAAVLAKFAPEWEATFREKLLSLMRDYANPSEEDRSYPVVRHKDWFLGFSWAMGIIVTNTKGRNQESTSEAVNAYYAVYAYAKMLEGKENWASDVKDLARIWLAMEAHGAETYWQIHESAGAASSEVYDETDFPDRVVGILWEHQATSKTWFSKSAFAVSGIQLLPFTPASETYLKADWVESHVKEFRNDCNADPQCAKGWSWTVCMEQAVVDKQGALGCIHSMPHDYFSPADKASGGNSLTNSLYWIATRPSFTDAIKKTSMPLAQELPALAVGVDEGAYQEGGASVGLNAGILKGLAGHNIINRYSGDEAILTQDGISINLLQLGMLCCFAFLLSMGAAIATRHGHSFFWRRQDALRGTYSSFTCAQAQSDARNVARAPGDFLLDAEANEQDIITA